jgi:PucR C-terminal helix-turn-helix domain/GGDEF-like domain
MSRIAQKATDSPDQVRTAVYGRLQARRVEIEQAALTRVYAVSDPTEAADPEYVEGLRAAVSAAIDYGFAGIKRSEERSLPLPAVLLTQARLAARNGISLDTVLRRYFAGYTLLSDFLMQEAEDGDLLEGVALKRLLRSQATLFDRLVAAVTEEYAREAGSRLDTAEQRRAERVERLLDGELLDTFELAYEFDAYHLGAIAAGPGAGEAIRDLAKTLDRRLLLISRGEGAVWAWLGARHRIDPAEFERLVSQSWPTQVSLAIGESGQGHAGWRLTHQQARAALPIALRSSQPLVRYADVALLASMLQDDVLVASLRELYLAPLEQERDGGEVARETLRAYFAADRNSSSSSAILGVSRQTVTNRLRTIEQLLGRPLNSCAAEVEAILRLEELEELPTLKRARRGG